jgi:hypothetical protein
MTASAQYCTIATWGRASATTLVGACDGLRRSRQPYICGNLWGMATRCVDLPADDQPAPHLITQAALDEQHDRLLPPARPVTSTCPRTA